MKLIHSFFIGLFFSIISSSNIQADCTYELFTVSSTKGTKIIDFVEQLSDECEFTIIVTDPNAEEFLNRNLNKTHLKNLTINEVFNVILKENNLSYTLEDNILRISYLTTKVFTIDYILSKRKSTTQTDITLSSSAGAGAMGGAMDAMGATGGAMGATGGAMGSGSTGESKVSITSDDDVQFWEQLDLEFQQVLNRPHDSYTAEKPIINKNAGLVTVTATTKQVNRFEEYLKQLQKKVKLQVLIDVQILTVTMQEGSNTGVDWSQLYKLQNLSLTTDFSADKTNKTPWTTTSAITATGGAALSEVIKFLDTQGDVTSISNPKVLTLNNQPALISVGTEFFYKTSSSSTLAGGATGTTTQNEMVESVFAGILLDITPEISDDNTITLKINPSLSETTEDVGTSSSTRTMPPDLARRQLSSVVTVKDGNRVILGGLINTKNTIDGNQVPVLGSIPILGNLFSYEEELKSTEELILIIEPHIVKKEKSDLSLKDLGYIGLNDALLDFKARSSSEDKQK